MANRMLRGGEPPAQHASHSACLLRLVSASVGARVPTDALTRAYARSSASYVNWSGGILPSRRHDAI